MLRIVVFFVLFSCTAAAQRDEVYKGRDTADKTVKKPKPTTQWKDPFTFGGNFQAWFGNPTFIFLSPTLGYNVNAHVNVGVGGIYNYTQYDNGIYGTFKQSIYGANTYVRYNIGQNFFVQTQLDKLYQPNFFSYVPDEKIWVTYWFVGGGFRHQLGNKAALTTSLMYNLTPNVLSIYPSRLIVQFGFTAGF